MNNICVCYSSDENGVDLFCVSLYSLLTYRNSDTFINCYLLHQHISIKAQNKIKLIVSKFKNVKFEFIDCSIYEEEYQIKDIKKHDLRLQ
jgi:lipopolysaccharide biosynthesis glycosyltransferase